MAFFTSYKQTDIILMQTSTYSSFTFILKDADDVAINLTGATIYFALKKDLDLNDNESQIFKTVTSHTDPINGISTFKLTDTDWSFTLEEDDNGNYIYWYAIKFVLADGSKDVPFWGKATIIKCPVKS